MQVVALPDLYAGKIAAALDRQHPRDLFDILHLYENEGITDDLFRAFLVYLVSHNRPAHELLAPHLLDLEDCYRSEEHTSELQSLMRISYAVFCLKKKPMKSYTTTHQATMILQDHKSQSHSTIGKKSA